MRKQLLFRVLLVNGLVLSAVCVIFQIIDIAIIFSILIFLYEFLIGNVLIIFNCSFNLLRYSIPYLFMFFLLCLFNVRYIGFIKLKFFGIDLQQYKYKSKINYLVFLFKEYNYWIIFVVNFLFMILLLYHVINKKFLISGLIVSFYIFIGLSVYIKRWLIKNNYYNKKTLNKCINISLVSIFSIYIIETGDAIEQYLGFKINLGEFLYGFFKQKDKLLFKLRHDNALNNYKWWQAHYLYKNQKASWNYLYFKNKNQKLLTDIVHKNKKVYINKSIKHIINKVTNSYKIQENHINHINFKNNNIYTDKNKVYYTNEKFDNQIKLVKKLNYANVAENKKLKVYLLNMKGFSAGNFVPKGIRTNFNLLFVLNKDKGSAIRYFNELLLDNKIAKKFNSYVFLQNKTNKQFLNILLNKNKSSTLKNLLCSKFIQKSALNLIKEKEQYFFKNNNNKLNYNFKYFYLVQKYIKDMANAFKHNFIYENLYSYNYFLNWWEKKHYIINNFFKGYNVKKYAPLTKYNFQGKNTLFNLFKKDSTDNIFKPIKIGGKIHEIKFKFKTSNYIDRNLLYMKYSYSKTIFKIKFLNYNNYNNYYNYNKIPNNDYNIVKNIDDKFSFIIKQNIIYKQPTYIENFLYDLVNWSKSTALKAIYLKYYSSQIAESYNFKLKKAYSPLVIYSEIYNNKYLATLHSKIEFLNAAEYHKIYRNISIYSYFFNKYMNFDFNNKINNLEGKINNTKKIYSIIFKDNNYNNKNFYSLFKYTYVWQLNDYLDISTYKNYIIKIAYNLDTDNNNTANLYFKQFLLKTSDILACYFSLNKMSFGQLIDYLKQWQTYFNKYANVENSLLKRKADYNFFFKTLKNPYLDRSVFLKEYFKALEALEADFEYSYSFSEDTEDLVEQQFLLLSNRINVCNLAYDTRTAMLHEHLDDLIDEIESNLLFKGEFKSCNKAAAYLVNDLQDLYTRQANCLDYITEKYKIYWQILKQDVLDTYKEIEDIEQLKRVFGKYSKKQLNKFIKNAKDREQVKYALNFTEEDAELTKQDINLQYAICVKYLAANKAQEQLVILDNYCCSLEELLENIIKMRDEDQINLMYSIENKLKSLKEFSLQRNIWLEEQHDLKLKKETEALTLKNWDLYNYNRFKNEIISFKNKK